MQTRKWKDQDGKDRYSTEVVLGNFKGELQILDSRSNSEQIENEIKLDIETKIKELNDLISDQNSDTELIAESRKNLQESLQKIVRADD